MAKELYVGHISYEATEDDLRRLFTVAGTVTSIHMITDAQTGEFKGCAYVRMSTVEEVQEAIASLDGALLKNRIITVSEARPQKQRTRPPGRGPGKPSRGPGKPAHGAGSSPRGEGKGPGKGRK